VIEASRSLISRTPDRGVRPAYPASATKSIACGIFSARERSARKKTLVFSEATRIGLRPS